MHYKPPKVFHLYLEKQNRVSLSKYGAWEAAKKKKEKKMKRCFAASPGFQLPHKTLKLSLKIK